MTVSSCKHLETNIKTAKRPNTTTITSTDLHIHTFEPVQATHAICESYLADLDRVGRVRVIVLERRLQYIFSTRSLQWRVQEKVLHITEITQILDMYICSGRAPTRYRRLSVTARQLC